MTDSFSTPNEYANDLQASDLHSSLAERLAAQGADALDPQNSLSGAWLFRRARELSAGGADLNPGTGGEAELFMDPAALQQRQAEVDARRAAIPDTSIDDAKTRIKQEGLEGHVKLPDQQSIKSPVLDLMISEGHERRDREAAIARGPQGFIPGALGLVTSLGVGMIDPVNAAAFSIPVLGEARWGKLLYSAGDSMLARAGVRALQGGAQGAVGTAVLQPADWWLHTRDGQDYTMADALKNIAMGAGMGAVAHAGLGALGDFGAIRRGEALPGSPEAEVTRALFAEHEPALAAAPGEAAPEPPITQAHPADVFADLPPAAKEDALRAAAADVIADRPVRSAEMLEIAADHDPRIGESVDAMREPSTEADIAKTEEKISDSLQPATDNYGERATRAADDPRWRALADAPPAHSDAQAIAESKAADAEPEPASVQPEKSQSAIEKAAADVEDAWRKSELAFSEEERQSVNEALDKIASDAKAREQIITEGAMCLAGRAIEEAA